jgi:hypothetical protein
MTACHAGNSHLVVPFYRNCGPNDDSDRNGGRGWWTGPRDCPDCMADGRSIAELYDGALNAPASPLCLHPKWHPRCMLVLGYLSSSPLSPATESGGVSGATAGHPRCGGGTGTSGKSTAQVSEQQKNHPEKRTPRGALTTDATLKRLVCRTQPRGGGTGGARRACTAHIGIVSLFR